MIAADKPNDESPSPALPRCGGVPVWHLIVSGFTQSLARPSGCQVLWDAIRRARANPEAAVLLLPWNSDWKAVAEFIWRFRPADRPQRVYVSAYSWGGGWGFRQVALELAKRSIGVEHAVLCDAVYRNPLWCLAWLSLVKRGPKVVAPPNVRFVEWFYQRQDPEIQGHEVVAEDRSRTTVYPGVRLYADHHYMDDQPAWQIKSLEVAAAARPASPNGSLMERLSAA